MKLDASYVEKLKAQRFKTQTVVIPIFEGSNKFSKAQFKQLKVNMVKAEDGDGYRFPDNIGDLIKEAINEQT